MKKLMTMLLMLTLAISVCACSKDTTKSDITEKTEALLEAIQGGDYETAATFVESDTVLSRAGFANYKKTFEDQVVNSLSTLTGVASIDDFDPALKKALDDFADLFLSKMMKSYEVNDDFQKVSDSEVTISANVEVLDGDVTSFTNSFSLGKESGTAFSHKYLKDHPEIVSEFNETAKTNVKAAYKRYFEAILTAYFNEQGAELFNSVAKTYAPKVWTITYKKVENDWVVTKIVETASEQPSEESSEESSTTEETTVEESTEETTEETTND